MPPEASILRPAFQALLHVALEERGMLTVQKMRDLIDEAAIQACASNRAAAADILESAAVMHTELALAVRKAGIGWGGDGS